MLDLINLLYRYAQDHRVEIYLDRHEYKTANHFEQKNLAALKDGLSEEHLAELERYIDACQEKQEMEQEAMFLAAFSMARELLYL